MSKHLSVLSSSSIVSSAPKGPLQINLNCTGNPLVGSFTLAPPVRLNQRHVIAGLRPGCPAVINQPDRQTSEQRRSFYAQAWNDLTVDLGQVLSRKLWEQTEVIKTYTIFHESFGIELIPCAEDQIAERWQRIFAATIEVFNGCGYHTSFAPLSLPWNMFHSDDASIPSVRFQLAA